MNNPHFEPITRGLQEIINSPIITKLINSYSIDETARRRISQIDYTNYPSFMYIKDNWFTIRPAEELSKLISGTDDTTTKWFLLLYSIASVNDIYRKYIYNYIDERIKKYWPDSSSVHAPRLNQAAELDHILDGLIDLDALKNQSGMQARVYNWHQCRQGITLFCLSAGYHWINASHYVAQEICDRGAGMPIILSFAYYVSVLTGKDFYDSLHDLLNSYGMTEALDDIITMVKAERTRQHLTAEKERLAEQLSHMEEAIRKQDTALDVIYRSYGSGASEKELNDRICSCNKNSSREVLYKAESIAGRKLSFTDEFNSSEEKESLASGLSTEYDITLSSSEVTSIGNVEELVNAVNDHRYFIAMFEDSLFYDHPFEENIGSSLYDLDTKIKEIRHLYGENIDCSNVTSVEDLRRAVIDANHGFKDLTKIVTDILGIDPSELNDNASFQNDLGADSIDIVDIIMEIEKLLNIVINDDEAADINTVGDAKRMINKKLREKAEKIIS